jgi:hypothetical protein
LITFRLVGDFIPLDFEEVCENHRECIEDWNDGQERHCEDVVEAHCCVADGMECNVMEYNGMCLFGFGRWRADGIIGKSGAWPKIFGWKLGVSRKIFGLKLEKSRYLWDYKDLGVYPKHYYFYT